MNFGEDTIQPIYIKHRLVHGDCAWPPPGPLQGTPPAYLRLDCWAKEGWEEQPHPCLGSRLSDQPHSLQLPLPPTSLAIRALSSWWDVIARDLLAEERSLSLGVGSWTDYLFGCLKSCSQKTTIPCMYMHSSKFTFYEIENIYLHFLLLLPTPTYFEKKKKSFHATVQTMLLLTSPSLGMLSWLSTSPLPSTLDLWYVKVTTALINLL